ncbi:glycosyltransferase 87 family protein [Conexibacter sp. DBS9H8]|uniref:glycosyltransferase 87 family protein n=1 Tax=Conexibacter sp. DBS9H8 TaxID=2937801 RepID=UPI0020109B37|nr:glycosyltransferase 87 family protein [Conexibacter sp. DBS9H8]
MSLSSPPTVIARVLPSRSAAARLAGAGAGWGLLGLSTFIYLRLSTRGPFHVGPRALAFFDLRVYRGAAVRVLDSAGLYSHPIIHHLGFTYPPAAAILLAPLAFAPLVVDEAVVLGLNLLALVWVIHSALALAGTPVRAVGRWPFAALIAAGALWLEPITVTLGYGQIDLLIAGLVLLDLSRPADAPLRGVAIGVAAGLKLTPLLLIVYLFLQGRRANALTALVAFLATIALSLAATGSAAIHYWGGLVLDSARVGGAQDAANQSLRGALARLLGVPHPGLEPEAIVVIVACGGLWLAVSAARRRETTLGTGLAIVTTLLASPVSWTHHWTLAVPGLVWLTVAALRGRSAALGAAALAAAAIGFAYIPERFMVRHESVTGLVSLTADPYVLIGVAALLSAAVREQRLRRRSSRCATPGLPGPR